MTFIPQRAHVVFKINNFVKLDIFSASLGTEVNSMFPNIHTSFSSEVASSRGHEKKL